MPEMHHEIELRYEALEMSRPLPPCGWGSFERRWAERLAKERYLPDYAASDLLAEVVPGGSLFGTQVIEKLTEEGPVSLMHHPRRAASAWGGTFWSSSAVAMTVVMLARLGVAVDAAALTAPLRKRLAVHREHPLVTHNELRLLWLPREDRAIHVFQWPDKEDSAIEPYAISLPHGRRVIGFADLDGRRVEIIGSVSARTLYEAANRTNWFSLSRAEFIRLASAAKPLQREPESRSTKTWFDRLLGEKSSRPSLQLINGGRDVGSARR